MTFSSRSDAGRRLAAALSGEAGRHPVVLALPRGGVPVAEPVARALGAPLDLVLLRKIGAPRQPELAIGAVADGPAPVLVRNDDIMRAAHVSEATFQARAQREWAELERRRARYLAGRARTSVAGRTAIVVDDGVATGATTVAALRAVRAMGAARVVLAVPVAPAEVLPRLEAEADEVVVLETPDPFFAVGAHYENFGQVEDAEVVETLARFPAAT